MTPALYKSKFEPTKDTPNLTQVCYEVSFVQILEKIYRITMVLQALYLHNSLRPSDAYMRQ